MTVKLPNAKKTGLSSFSSRSKIFPSSFFFPLTEGRKQIHAKRKKESVEQDSAGPRDTREKRQKPCSQKQLPPSPSSVVPQTSFAQGEISLTAKINSDSTKVLSAQLRALFFPGLPLAPTAQRPLIPAFDGLEDPGPINYVCAYVLA